jgi:hypothetical protein
MEVRVSTFANMVRRIRNDLNRGSSHDTRIKEAICDAIEYFTPRRLGFNQKRAQTVLESAREFIALPTDWIEVDHMRLELDSERRPLTEVAFDWIEDNQRGQVIAGEPTHYAIHAREARFYPVPDRSYTLVMSFHCEFNDISVSASDGATNAWMTEGELLVRTRALGDLYMNYIGGAETQKGVLLKEEADQRILPTMERRAARENTSGRIPGFL